MRGQVRVRGRRRTAMLGGVALERFMERWSRLASAVFARWLEGR